MLSPRLGQGIYGPRHREGGAVLVVGLVILGILMLGAMAMMRTSVEDERIVSNKRVQAQAFLTAEAGLMHAQQALNVNWDEDTCSAHPDGSPLFLNGDSFNQKEFSGQGIDHGARAHYTVSMEDCASSPMLTSVAEVSGSGASVTLVAAYQPPLPPGIDPLDPPAAISCFGGACELGIKGGGNDGIHGLERDIPPENCTGKHCEMGYNGGLMKPAVYMSDGGSISVSGGGASTFTGSRPGDPETAITVSTKNNPESTVWHPENYPVDEHGQHQVPGSEMFFGDDAIIKKVDRASDVWGSFAKPEFVVLDDDSDTKQPAIAGLKNATVGGVMVIDGVDISNQGTGAFAGLIVIKNCGTFSPGGNYSVYGAIVVDAEGCDDYQPFGGNGTPSVNYSLDAIKDGINTLPPSGPGALANWQQIINY